MTILRHERNGTTVAEVVGEGLLIREAGDALDMLGNVYYQGFDRMILHAGNITPEFFRLHNGLAGEILQKYANYRMRLVIVGDFSSYTSGSVRDFIYESNQGEQVNFLGSVEQALLALQV